MIPSIYIIFIIEKLLIQCNRLSREIPNDTLDYTLHWGIVSLFWDWTVNRKSLIKCHVASHDVIRFLKH